MRRPRPSVKPRQHARRPGAASGRAAALARLVPYRLATLADLVVRAAERRFLRRFGLATREWRILAVLGEGRPLSAGELSRRTAIGRGQVARAAASLSRRGLVMPEADAFDARHTMLRLSRKGRALYRRMVPVAAAHERALTAGFTAPERRALERLLARLHERAAAMLAAPGRAHEDDATR